MDNVFIFPCLSHRRSDAVLDNEKCAMKNVFIFPCPPTEEVVLCWTMENGQCKMYLFFLARPTEVMLCWTMKKFFLMDNGNVLIFPSLIFFLVHPTEEVWSHTTSVS